MDAARPQAGCTESTEKLTVETQLQSKYMTMSNKELQECEVLISTE